MRGEMQAKDSFIQRYLNLAIEKLANFKMSEVAHAQQKEKTWKYVLYRLESVVPFY